LALRTIIAAGGTGGHIYPGIAIAREILRREPASEVLFVGTARGLETKIIPREGFRLELMRVRALKGVGMIERARSLALLPFSFVSAWRMVSRFRPDAVIGVGGYSSGPTLLAAALRGIPTIVIEPNAMPGFTNRVLARFIDAAAVSFEESLSYFRGRGRVTGNPVRPDFAALEPKQRGDRMAVLIFGGSQGARSINVAMAGALPLLAAQKEKLAFTHQTGERDLEEVSRAYRAAGFEDADVRPFIHDMAEQFRRADLIVSRSGATTVAEIAAAGKAALFVPFPFATDDHQRRNAEAFEKAGAARLIPQTELTSERLARELIDLANNPEMIGQMERAGRALGRPDAAQRTVDLALEVISKKSDFGFTGRS
jgi:UDP-N-acetylglucosamine--N-acetylmuramyl-(pentapeptide) pyrophosphoryl-undecaprenol N-acetylglucosamine transferase